MTERRELFDWFFSNEKTFTVEEVEELVERILEFDSGCTDDYLTKHANKVFDEWLEEKQK